MLANILKIILVFLILRMLYPLFKGMGTMFDKPSAPGPRGEKKDGTERDYSDLTPYEIEDADFEDMKKK